MPNVEQLTDWLGQDVIDSQGESLGKLEDVYYSSDGEAQLALVKHGLLGRKQTIVPLADATVSREYLRVAYSSEQIEHANENVDGETGARLDGPVVQQLGQAYGVQMGAEDLDSAAAVAERREAAREAEERAERLEAEARAQAEDAQDARAQAGERTDQATNTERAAQEAREEANRLQP